MPLLHSPSLIGLPMACCFVVRLKNQCIITCKKSPVHLNIDNIPFLYYLWPEWLRDQCSRSKVQLVTLPRWTVQSHSSQFPRSDPQVGMRWVFIVGRYSDRGWRTDQATFTDHATTIQHSTRTLKIFSLWTGQKELADTSVMTYRSLTLPGLHAKLNSIAGFHASGM